ncbi:hypothetical protein TYRP_009126 [Tyrophagus putrescentiae]|nr:hypothetical protein TYRP_009126 [Tyrophagus putrescentiae]
MFTTVSRRHQRFSGACSWSTTGMQRLRKKKGRQQKMAYIRLYHRIFSHPLRSIGQSLSAALPYRLAKINSGLDWLMPLMAEKTSGAPLPKARSVTPCLSSSSSMVWKSTLNSINSASVR